MFVPFTAEGRSKQYEDTLDALSGKPRADGSRMQSFGFGPETKNGAWTGRTVYRSAYDNGDIVETIVERSVQNLLA